MTTRREFDHIGNFNFKVDIEGVTVAAFKDVEGLDSETDVINVDDGTDTPGVDNKRPGRTKYSNIVLKRGYVNTEELWSWRKAVIDGNVERKSGSVILLEDNGEEICRYNFFEGWPAKWKGFDLDGGNDGVNVEEVEMAVERIERG